MNATTKNALRESGLFNVGKIKLQVADIFECEIEQS